MKNDVYYFFFIRIDVELKNTVCFHDIYFINFDYLFSIYERKKF